MAADLGRGGFGKYGRRNVDIVKDLKCRMQPDVEIRSAYKLSRTL